MASLLFGILVVFLLALPVRVAASWFDAKRKSWGASILVLFLGAALVNATFYYLPEAWIAAAATLVRYLLIFAIFFVVSGFVLDIKLWQAAVLSAFIGAAYGFSVSPLGEAGVRFGH
jgi:hypothetical protein